jgi:peptidoglycan/LPS O-acetylase OafA/YrhL
MAKSLGSLRVLLWIGVVLMLLWFLVFCFGPAKLLARLNVSEGPTYFLRLYGVFPLSWGILLCFALKDIEKNMAIINALIITGILVCISVVVYGFVLKETGAFHWTSAVVILVYSLLIYFFKPEIKKA